MRGRSTWRTCKGSEGSAEPGERVVPNQAFGFLTRPGGTCWIDVRCLMKDVPVQTGHSKGNHLGLRSKNQKDTRRKKCH